MQEVLDEFDIIECFELPGKQLQAGETKKRQINLYAKLGVTPSLLNNNHVRKLVFVSLYKRHGVITTRSDIKPLEL